MGTFPERNWTSIGPESAASRATVARKVEYEVFRRPRSVCNGRLCLPGRPQACGVPSSLAAVQRAS
jgi:hypothetical protein